MNAATLDDKAPRLVTVFLDCEPKGCNGMKQCLSVLAELTPVRLAWSERMDGGKFRGRQSESLTPDEWLEITTFLRAGNPVTAAATIRSEEHTSELQSR